MAKQTTFLTVLLILFLLLSTVSCQGLEEPSSMVDSDGDGWSNGQETIAGTDPHSVDTDNDGYWDPHDPNPLDPNIPVDKGLPEPTPSTTTQTPEPTPSTTTQTPEPTVTPAEPATPSVSPAITPDTPEEAAAEELHNVQAAVKVMMNNNNLTWLAHPLTVPTNDMQHFPDASTSHGNLGVGYVLYCHDFNGDGKPDTNYIHFSKTKGTYICDELGNVTQVTTGYE